LREEHRQREFHNTVLRKIFGPRRDGEHGIEEDEITRNFRICNQEE
jgi:hypothetical protein